MGLIVFIVCMMMVSIGNSFDDYKKERASFYYDHYNRLPENERARTKKMGDVVKNEVWARGVLNSNAAGKWVLEYMTDGRSFNEAKSLWIMDHCKAKGIPCTKFIADEIAGVHEDENSKRRAEDAEKYGWEYTMKNNYLYL